MCLVKVPRDVPLKFLQQQWNSFLPPALMANRVLDLNLGEDSVVDQCDKEGVSDRAFLRVVVVFREAFVLDAINLGPKGVYARVSGSFILAVHGCEVG